MDIRGIYSPIARYKEHYLMSKDTIPTPSLCSILDDFRSRKLSYSDFERQLRSLSTEELRWMAQESTRRIRDASQSRPRAIESSGLNRIRAFLHKANVN
jgi:hypothetical protein